MLPEKATAFGTVATGRAHEPVGAGPAERPVWDDAARELSWHCRLVKRFRHDAANQRLILTAFQELDWAPRIDDPLPREAGVNAKVRLRETVKSLQRGQKPLVLCFHADGTGCGLRWEAII